MNRRNFFGKVAGVLGVGALAGYAGEKGLSLSEKIKELPIKLPDKLKEQYQNGPAPPFFEIGPLFRPSITEHYIGGNLKKMLFEAEVHHEAVFDTHKDRPGPPWDISWVNWDGKLLRGHITEMEVSYDRNRAPSGRIKGVCWPVNSKDTLYVYDPPKTNGFTASKVILDEFNGRGKAPRKA